MISQIFGQLNKCQTLTDISTAIAVNTTFIGELQSRLANHQQWWRTFGDRSYSTVSTPQADQKSKVQNVNRGYALLRYMNACAGRGGSPIKFKGCIFTVDTEDLSGEFHGIDTDYRRWGAPFWWQNTRLPYWAMLEAGDFDLMEPLFNMYKNALPIRKLATQKYYGPKGAFFPEIIYFWGTYVNGNYGRNRMGLTLGEKENPYRFPVMCGPNYRLDARSGPSLSGHDCPSTDVAAI